MVAWTWVCGMPKIENGNGEYAKETTTWPEGQKTADAKQWISNTRINSRIRSRLHLNLYTKKLCMLEYVRSYLSKRAKQRINKQILSFEWWSWDNREYFKKVIDKSCQSWKLDRWMGDTIRSCQSWNIERWVNDTIRYINSPTTTVLYIWCFRSAFWIYFHQEWLNPKIGNHL